MKFKLVMTSGMNKDYGKFYNPNEKIQLNKEITPKNIQQEIISDITIKITSNMDYLTNKVIKAYSYETFFKNEQERKQLYEETKIKAYDELKKQLYEETRSLK